MQQKKAASAMGAAWQRMAMATPCSVQEDVKRAPKLACCQQQSSLAIDPETSVDTLSSRSFGDDSFCSDFSADRKWWLKGSTDSQLNSLEEELGILNPGFVNSFFEDIKFKKIQELMESREDYACLETGIPGKLNEMHFESPWMPSKKSTPWWRTVTDTDELALLVAKNSFDHIQNCDLPPPQNIHNRIHGPSGDTQQRSGSSIRETGFQESGKTSWKERVLITSTFEKSHSNSSSDSKNSSPRSPGNDLNKAQLLEALRHSQTRAREAEKAAREAYSEKEHIITLLFRQASQLFAYKQWFQLLQLEALYNKEKQISGRNQRKRWQRSKRGEIGRYVVAFALGFSLIGAGLLLGWTVGWLLPF